MNSKVFPTQSERRQSARVLVTGSAGHLGEALMRALPLEGYNPVGLDVKASPFTHLVGSIVDRNFVKRCMNDIDAVLHTATLHKPHVVTHSRQDFIDTNITGTLNLLEESSAAQLRAFIFTSSTSVFGRAMVPSSGEPAAWVTEDLVPLPKNIYGVTKLAAEQLCELFHRKHLLPCLILRTSRFFPEPDDEREIRNNYGDANAKVNEFLYRRADLEDIVSAHRLAMERAPAIGFGRYIVSATTPFRREDLATLCDDAPAVVRRRVPLYESIYTELGWKIFPKIDRVYDNTNARLQLGWEPKFDFATILDRLRAGEDYRSPLAVAVGAKGYHSEVFADGPYPV